ncbi:hypothetical protein HPB52_015075 [Rhipicephalus sanguineus]|uniref:Uncharacterized protein n=1 Tax=Rhipicephalus sanguineus TaxID=34632 RepID=A0A9D4Q1I9_RHISA|nr:hypothetical protein HPB52_015075 [Rhipicephalus sanguineus]
MSRLRDSVGDWTPFMLEDMDECAERTRRRQAVFIEGSLYQKRYAYSFRGQVQVSSDTFQDFMFMCYVLPKASPYEDLVQNAKRQYGSVLDLLVLLVSEPSVVLGKKRSVRILRVTLQLLLFIFSYCFTGGYISFLNRPILEEVPDTKEKLLAMLRTGRLQPCVSNNSFSSVLITSSYLLPKASPYKELLHNM